MSIATVDRDAIKEVLIRPLITEKSTTQATDSQKYTFEVPKWANKYHVRAAIEATFENVKVKKVNISKIFGHSKRTRKGKTLPKDAKKAIVTIDGPHIDLFPEV